MTDVTLLHGDCLKLMPTLPAQSVQMVFADLPYRSKQYYSTECPWDIAIDLSQFWLCLEKFALNTVKVFTASQPFTSMLIHSNLKQYRSHIVWDKKMAGGFMRAKLAPMKFHEDVIVFAKMQPTYNPQMTPLKKPYLWKESASKRSLSGGPRKRKKGLTILRTHKYPNSIVQFCMASDKARGIHPTQKPVALLEWLIKTYTNPGDTVLDPVAGSFTTAIACLRTGRKCIAIEKDAGYFALGKARVEAERARMVQASLAI